MKKIEQFLQENNIEYERNKYGNPYYFNDNFSVEGITVSFYFDGIGNAWEDQKIITEYFKNKKSYIVQSSRFGAGYCYRILRTFDARRLEEHQQKIDEASMHFWQARRLSQAMQTGAV